MIGIGVGAVVGTGYSLHQLNKTTTHIVNEETIIPLINYVPKVDPSRQVSIYFYRHEFISMNIFI